MFHLLCIFVTVGAAFMPDMLNLLAAGLAITACFTLAIFKHAVEQAIQQQIAPPDPRVHFGTWAIILVAASMVHWFPLACFVFVFIVESAFYSKVKQ